MSGCSPCSSWVQAGGPGRSFARLPQIPTWIREVGERSTRGSVDAIPKAGIGLTYWYTHHSVEVSRSEVSVISIGPVLALRNGGRSKVGRLPQLRFQTPFDGALRAEQFHHGLSNPPL